MGFSLISGIVRDLSISRDYENILVTQTEMDLLGVGAIGAAAIGEGLGAKILAGASSDSQVGMEFFTCVVGGQLLHGKSYVVEIHNGELIHFVVDDRSGKNDVVAFQDTVNRIIWTLPYRTKGHIAQRASNTTGIVASSLGIAVVLFIAGFYCGEDSPAIRESSALTVALFGFLFTFIVGFHACRRVYKNSISATETFELLNFADPENVNLPKQNRKAEKKYERESGRIVARSSNPLRFRYDICSMKTFDRSEKIVSR